MHVLIEKMYAAVTHFYKALGRYYFAHKSNLFCAKTVTSTQFMHH